MNVLSGLQAARRPKRLLRPKSQAITTYVFIGVFHTCLTVDPMVTAFGVVLQYFPAVFIASPVIRIRYKNQRVSLKVRKNDVSKYQILQGCVRPIRFSVTEQTRNSIVRENCAAADALTTERILLAAILGYQFKRKAKAWTYMALATAALDSAATRCFLAAAKTATFVSISFWHGCLRGLRRRFTATNACL